MSVKDVPEVPFMASAMTAPWASPRDAGVGPLPVASHPNVSWAALVGSPHPMSVKQVPEAPFMASAITAPGRLARCRAGPLPVASHPNVSTRGDCRRRADSAPRAASLLK
jgi:hypothetical protein